MKDSSKIVIALLLVLFLIIFPYDKYFTVVKPSQPELTPLELIDRDIYIHQALLDSLEAEQVKARIQHIMVIDELQVKKECLIRDFEIFMLKKQQEKESLNMDIELLILKKQVDSLRNGGYQKANEIMYEKIRANYPKQ